MDPLYYNIPDPQSAILQQQQQQQQPQPAIVNEPPQEAASGPDFNEIAKKVLETIQIYFQLFWAWLETLPLKPEETLGIAGGVLALVILISCCICCRFCCKKKEEKKEVKDKLDVRKSHLFGPHYAERIQTRFDEVDYNIESTLFDALEEIKLGQVRFSIEFDNEENIVYITVHEARNIPAADISGYSDPFIKVLLKPASKKEYKTEVKKSTLTPVYDQTFRFKNVTYAGLTTSTLWLKVYDHDFGGSDLLGEAKIPVNDLDLTKGKLTQWKLLVPEFKSEAGRFGKDSGLGHICIGLGYSANSSILAIFILSCKDLLSVDEGGFSDPYVTLFLIRDGKKLKKRKTTVKLRTLNPAFNESFAFEVDMDDFVETSVLFIVADYDKGQPGEPIGQCMIGQLGQGLGAKHWEKVRRSPGKPIMNWHMLKEIIVPE